MTEFTRTAKQEEALDVLASCKTALLEGGGRSGKTVEIVRDMVTRALHYPGTDHLAARLRLSHARTSIWNKTLPDVLGMMGIKGAVVMNAFDMTAYFPIKGTGKTSRLMIGGLDDKERTEKILGNEFATIFLNETSQISFDTYETVATRHNAPKGIPTRFWLDQNPGSKRHWTYRIFHDRKFPDGRPVPDGDFHWLKMNPADNVENLNQSYFDTLNNLSASKRRRFRDGEYGTDEGAMWQRAWFKYAPRPVNLVRVVVGVDPAGSVAGDEIGIVAAGMDDHHNKFILDDGSMHGTPEEWGNEVLACYDREAGDVIAAEKNFGGDMVEAVITKMGTRNVNVKLVNASRGKAVRAEPIAAMYQRGEVTHVKEFVALEDELCTWKPAEDTKSPNRLDALVWALTELTEGTDSMDWVG